MDAWVLIRWIIGQRSSSRSNSSVTGSVSSLLPRVSTSSDSSTSLLTLMNSDDKAKMIAVRRVITAALGFAQIPGITPDLVVSVLDAMIKRNMEAVVKLL